VFRVANQWSAACPRAAENAGSSVTGLEGDRRWAGVMGIGGRKLETMEWKRRAGRARPSTVLACPTGGGELGHRWFSTGPGTWGPRGFRLPSRPRDSWARARTQARPPARRRGAPELPQPQEARVAHRNRVGQRKPPSKLDNTRQCRVKQGELGAVGREGPPEVGSRIRRCLAQLLQTRGPQHVPAESAART